MTNLSKNKTNIETISNDYNILIIIINMEEILEHHGQPRDPGIFEI